MKNNIVTIEELKLVNDHASTRWSAQREKSHFDKATKISDRDYQGFVYWGDEYFSEMKEMLDRLMEDCNDPEDIPEYVWATDPHMVIPSLDIGHVVADHMDNNGWEEMEMGDLNGVNELQVALNIFVEANKTVVSYFPDYKTAVVISPETRAELVAQISGSTTP